MKFTGTDIAQATGGVLHGDDQVGVLWTDTRTMPANAWFVALVGARFDGHRFAADAWAAGARGGVFTHCPEGWTGPWVQVDDTTRALQDVARLARSRLACPVVGLTGSSGKTTTRALLALALKQLGAVHQTQGNLNNHWGVPMTLLAADADCDAAIIEMGTSAPGEIAVLADIATPEIRLVVNVGPAHLEELGGLEGVAVEKGALFRAALPSDILLVNLDDPRVVAMSGAGRRVTWGRHEDAQIRLVSHDIDAARWSATVTWETPDGPVRAVLPDPSPHVALDAAGALAAAWALGLDVARAAEDLEHYAPVGMRLRPVSLPGGAVVISDAYNANPQSTRASVALLARLGGRRTAVLGDMLELGPEEARFHAEVAQAAAASGIERLFLVGPRMSLAADAVPAGACEVLSCPTVDGVGARLAASLHADDHILLKASRGARLERVLGDLQEILSEDA